MRAVFALCSNGFDVTRCDAIELHAGSSPGLRACHQVVCLLAMVAILWSRAEPMWIVMMLLALGAAYRATGRITRSITDHGRLVLHADGNAVVYSVNGTVPTRTCAGGWVTRWFSVVSLKELLSGRAVRVLICRSSNSPDDYRRLLVILRMHTAHASDRAITWL